MRNLLATAKAALQQAEVHFTPVLRIRQARSFFSASDQIAIGGNFQPQSTSYLHEPVSHKAVGVSIGEDGYLWIWAEDIGAWFKPTLSGNEITILDATKACIVYDALVPTNLYIIYQASATVVIKLTITKSAWLAGTQACITASSTLFTFSESCLAALHETHDEGMLGIFATYHSTVKNRGVTVAYYDWAAAELNENHLFYCIDPTQWASNEYLDSAACGRHVFVSMSNGSVMKCSLLSTYNREITWTAWREVVPADLSYFKVHNAYLATVESENSSQEVFHLVGRFQRVDPVGSFSSDYAYLFDLESVDEDCNLFQMGPNNFLFYWNTSTDADEVDYARYYGVYNTSTRKTHYCGKSFYMPVQATFMVDPRSEYLEIANIDLEGVQGDIFSGLTIPISEGDTLYRTAADTSGRTWLQAGNILSLYIRVNNSPIFEDSPSGNSFEIPYWSGVIEQLETEAGDAIRSVHVAVSPIAYKSMASQRYAHYLERMSPLGQVAEIETMSNVYPLFTGTQPTTTFAWKGIGQYKGNTFLIGLRQLITDNVNLLVAAQDPFYSLEFDLSVQGAMGTDGEVGLAGYIIDDRNFIGAVLVNKTTLKLRKYLDGISTDLASVAITGSSEGFALRMRSSQGRIQIWCKRAALDPNAWSKSLVWNSTPDINYPIDPTEIQINGQTVSYTGVYLKSGTHTTDPSFWDFRSTSLGMQAQTIRHLLSELCIMAGVRPLFPNDIVAENKALTFAMKDMPIL